MKTITVQFTDDFNFSSIQHDEHISAASLLGLLHMACGELISDMLTGKAKELKKILQREGDE